MGILGEILSFSHREMKIEKMFRYTRLLQKPWYVLAFQLCDLQQPGSPVPPAAPQPNDQRRSMPPPTTTVQNNSDVRRTSVPPNMRPMPPVI